MATTRTQRAHRRNVQGNATPFVAGLNNARLTALDSLAWQAFTEVSGLNIEKTDNTNITMPNDDDGFNLVEITTGYGSLQEQTATLTEYMDERQNTSWIAGVKRDLPGSLWLPQGRGRQRSDKDDFTSGTLIDLFRLQSDNQDDNANPSEGDVGNPNKISVGISFHGRNRHTIRPASFKNVQQRGGGTYAITNPIGGTAVLESREDTGSVSRRWFLLEHGASSAMPKLHERDAFGNWSSEEFGANDDKPGRAAIAGGSIVSMGSTSHFSIPIDDPSTAQEVASGGFGANTIATDIYVKSTSEIYSVGGASKTTALGIGNSTRGRIFFTKNSLNTFSRVQQSERKTSYAAIDGFSNQIVVVGGSRDAYKHTWAGTSTTYALGDVVVHSGSYYQSNKSITAGGGNSNPATATSDWVALSGDDVRTAGTVALILVSKDGGSSFTEVDGPEDAKELSAVFMTDVDTFWVGSRDGKVWWTYNFGETWNSVTLGTNLTVIDDISFLWPSGAEQASRIGYITGRAGAATKTARVLRTIEGGASWHSASRKSFIDAEITGTAHANTRWNQISVSGAQSLIIGGTQGDDSTPTDITAFVELE